MIRADIEALLITVLNRCIRYCDIIISAAEKDALVITRINKRMGDREVYIVHVHTPFSGFVNGRVIQCYNPIIKMYGSEVRRRINPAIPYFTVTHLDGPARSYGTIPYIPPVAPIGSGPTPIPVRVPSDRVVLVGSEIHRRSAGAIYDERS